MTRRRIGRAFLAFTMLVIFAAPALGQTEPVRPRLLRVPQDYLEVQDAIDDSQPGDVVLIERGTYLGGWTIPAHKTDITIRGVDRNEVLIDGEDERSFAFEIHADGVAIENMTAHNFTATPFYWEEVERYVGRYLTVYRVGGYGLYARAAQFGSFDNVYVTGAARAAYYIGECNPCGATITKVVARDSELGVSATNATGLTIEESLFEYNGSGIILSSFNEEADAPQGNATVRSNIIYKNGAVQTPSNGPLGGYVGIGIGIAGGRDNVIVKNEVEANTTYGIAVFASAQTRGGYWEPSGNQILRNHLVENSEADLALGTRFGTDNCFGENRSGLTLPRDLQQTLVCDAPASPLAAGSGQVTEDLSLTLEALADNRGSRPSYKRMAEPERQPNMPGAADGVAGFAPAHEDKTNRTPFVWFALVVVAVTGAGLVAFRYRRERLLPLSANR